MNYTDLVAVEAFAKKLKLNFPILLNPKDFTDRLINQHNEHAHKIIDLAVEVARIEFDLQAQKEAKHYGKS